MGSGAPVLLRVVGDSNSVQQPALVLPVGEYALGNQILKKSVIRILVPARFVYLRQEPKQVVYIRRYSWQ